MAILPKQVLGHPWVLVGEDKMSKSKGNVIYADELAERFGIDAVRYYLLSEIPFTQDGTITYESFITKFNADLANTLDNVTAIHLEPYHPLGIHKSIKLGKTQGYQNKEFLSADSIAPFIDYMRDKTSINIEVL